MTTLVGAWRLVRSEWQPEGDPVRLRPQAPGAVGYIMYTADGHVAFMSMASAPAKFAVDDIRGGTPEDKLSAYENFGAYCGTYEVHDGTVVHHVEASLFPNWVGTDQVRSFVISDDELIVTIPPLLSEGKTQRIRLVFQRAAR